MTCKSCKWFDKGATDGLMHKHLIMLDGRSPSTSDMMQYRMHNKDGLCRFSPRPEQNLETEFCGQHAERREG